MVDIYSWKSKKIFSVLNSAKTLILAGNYIHNTLPFVPHGNAHLVNNRISGKKRKAPK
jgi:hypothetical protein